MSRVFVVSGVHLDRAWTDYPSGVGSTLRAWSREILPSVVQQAAMSEASTLLVLGDLLDRDNVSPDTIEYAAATLGRFAGSVVIAPGQRDWFGDSGPYEVGTWMENTTIWSSEAFTESAEMPGLYGSAWTAADSPSPRAPDAAASHTRVWARAQMAQLPSSGGTDLALTSGQALEVKDGAFVVSQLVHEPQYGQSGGLVLDVGGIDIAAQIVSLPSQPGSAVELDTSRLLTQERFDAALVKAARATAPVVIRLTGVLPQGVLLPDFNQFQLPDNVHVDLAQLHFSTTTPDLGDHSMQAEFLRSVQAMEWEALDRHQTIALGLQALASTNGESA